MAEREGVGGDGQARCGYGRRRQGAPPHSRRQARAASPEPPAGWGGVRGGGAFAACDRDAGFIYRFLISRRRKGEVWAAEGTPAAAA